MSAAGDVNCSLLNPTEVTMEMDGFDNCTSDRELDPTRLLLVPVALLSLVGNLCTLALLAFFKRHTVADVLVGGLAVTDLILVLVPVPLSIYSYLTLVNFPQDSPECIIHTTVSLFSRLSACTIVTVIAVNKCVAICAPFAYRKYATPKVLLAALCVSWLINLSFAIVPAFDTNSIVSHDGFCLFDLASDFAISVAVSNLIQLAVVLVSFALATVVLLHNLRTRNKRSARRTASKYEEGLKVSSKAREHNFVEMMSKFRRKTVLNLAQASIEAQFLTMFTVVVILFYVTWIPVVVSIYNYIYKIYVPQLYPSICIVTE